MPLKSERNKLQRSQAEPAIQPTECISDARRRNQELLQRQCADSEKKPGLKMLMKSDHII